MPGERTSAPRARRWSALPAAVLGLTLAGCALVGRWMPPTPEATVAPAATASPQTTRPAATRPAPAATLIPSATPDQALTLWLPPEMVEALSDPPELGALIAEQQRVLVEAQPGLTLHCLPKAAYGAGGIVDLLLATQPVAPGRLPDLAAVDAADLSELVAQGLAVPLEGLLPSTAWDDLFPFALEAATVQDRLYAFPFQADITFMAYNTTLLPQPPQRWDDLATSGGTYLFPAAQGDGSAADAFLIQYLARGASFAAAAPKLDSVMVAQVLRDYRLALEAGALPASIRDVQSLDESWAAYIAGEAAMANIGSRQFLRGWAQLKRTKYAMIPTHAGKPLTLARSWAWVVITQAPERQKLAADYILGMTAAEPLASWARVSGHLPTRRSSLVAIADTELRAFLEQELLNARPYPSAPDYAPVQTALARAIEDVLSGINTPERAAIAAAASVSRMR